MNAIDEVVDRVTSVIGNDYRQSIGVMLVCLPEVERFLPDVGRDALAMARRFWTYGTVSPEALEEVRVQCWSFLDV